MEKDNKLTISKQQIKDELKRLNIDPDGRMDFQSVEIKDILDSSFFEGSAFDFFDTLFGYETPRIKLEKGLYYRKSNDNFGGEKGIYKEEKNSFKNSLLIKSIQTDAGLGSNQGTMCWRHRTDISFKDLTTIIADEYREFHQHILDNNPKFKEWFLKEREHAQYSIFTGKDYDDENPVQEVSTGDLPEEIYSEFDQANLLRDFHSLDFHNGALSSGLCGDVYFFGMIQKYEKGKGQVFVDASRSCPEKEYVNAWTRGLMDKTSFTADPEFKEITNYIESLSAPHIFLTGSDE